jgi:hypothetical protein
MHGPLNGKSGKYSHILTMTNTATVRNILCMLMYDKLNVVGICANENQWEKYSHLSLSLINTIPYFKEIVIKNSTKKNHDVFVE